MGGHDDSRSIRVRALRALRTMLLLATLLIAGVSLRPAPAVASVTASPGPIVMPMVRNLVPVRAAGQPTPGPLTYGGGQVEVTPKIYLVFWGWSNSADPAATLMQHFIGGLGGTPWAGIDNQYYETVN